MKEFKKFAIGLSDPAYPESFTLNRGSCASLAASESTPGEVTMNTPMLLKLAAIFVALTVNGLILSGVEYLFDA